MAQELLSPHVVMAHCKLLGMVATKWPVEALTGGVCLLGEGSSLSNSLVVLLRFINLLICELSENKIFTSCLTFLFSSIFLSNNTGFNKGQIGFFEIKLVLSVKSFNLKVRIKYMLSKFIKSLLKHSLYFLKPFFSKIHKFVFRQVFQIE